jgi:hypothetical protein
MADERRELELRRKLSKGVSPRDELEIRKEINTFSAPKQTRRSDPFQARAMDRPDEIPHETQMQILKEGAILGGLTLGSAVVPQLTVPAAAARIGTIGARLANLGLRGAGSAVGGGGAELATGGTPREAVTTAAAGLIGEGVGTGVTALGKKVLSPFVKKLIPGAKEAIQSITTKGGVLTPGKASESRLLDTLESVSGSSLFGGGRIQTINKKAAEIAKEGADEFLKKFSQTASREDTGVLIQDIVTKRGNSFKEAGARIFGNVDDLAQGSVVNLSKTKQLAADILVQSERGLGDPALKRVVNRIISKPDQVSFKDAQILRSDLLAITRKSPGEIVAGKASAFGKRLAPEVDKAMAQGAKNLNPQALTAWREANAFWRKGSEVFHDSMIKNLSVRSPDQVFNAAIAFNKPAAVRKVRNLVDDRGVWENIQGQWARDVFEKSTDELGELSGKKLLKQIKKWDQGGSLRELMSPTQISNARQIARTLQIAETAASSEKIGSVAIQLLQVGAAGTVFSLSERSTGGAGTAAAIIFGPAIMARALTNRSISRWLTIGLRAPTGSRQATLAASKVSAYLLSQGATREEQ